MLISYLLCLLLVACVVTQDTLDSESRLVYTAQGPVRGYKNPDYNVYSFYNIPYATAPTGTNKFKAPLPPPTWQEPLEAINRNIVCPQPDTGATNKPIQEDCLVANIHIPAVGENNIPVVVYVHAGGFQYGYGNMVEPAPLVQNKNVIVVTFNYRLGIHGFLCLGTPDAPGNAGMKDQVALLRWVKMNIAKFGGRSHDITIIGCSAGSASVDLLMLSKTTNGLFNKVISGSGCSMSPFAAQIDPLEKAKEQAKVLNFSNVDDIYALEEFYKNMPMEYLLLENTFATQKDTGVVFAPCVERYTGVEMFLSEAPYDILRSKKYKKLPVIYGFTEMEGLMRLRKFEEWKDEMNENFSDFLPGDLHFRNEEEKKNVAQTVKEFYFGDQPVSEDNILSYIDFQSDVNFVHSMLWLVDIQVGNRANNIYLYEYSFVDDNVSLIPYTNVRGAEHCAQEFGLVDYSGYSNLDDTELSAQSSNTKEIMTEMWYNFITTGQPVPMNSSLPMWPPVGPYNSPHMSFGQTVELKGPLLGQRKRFWDYIYARYYRAPQAPNPYIPQMSTSK